MQTQRWYPSDKKPCFSLGVGSVKPGLGGCSDVGIYHVEWGIGFRVEDNLLVTEDGCENLSAAIPRTVEDIEAVMRKG